MCLLPGTSRSSCAADRRHRDQPDVAYLDGRIHEVALDWYAQADDGSAWYFGEDVFNYEDGKVADTEGTWIVGGETPAAMIMPAKSPSATCTAPRTPRRSCSRDAR